MHCGSLYFSINWSILVKLSIVSVCVLSCAFVVCRVFSGNPLFYSFSLLSFPFQFHCFLIILLLLPSFCFVFLIYSSFPSLLSGLDVLIFCFLMKAFNAIGFFLRIILAAFVEWIRCFNFLFSSEII